MLHTVAEASACMVGKVRSKLASDVGRWYLMMIAGSSALSKPSSRLTANASLKLLVEPEEQIVLRSSEPEMPSLRCSQAFEK